MRKFQLLLLVICMQVFAACAPSYVEISRSDLSDRIAGAWLGQMVGNIYGLEYENDFVDEPGPGGPYTFQKSIGKMVAVDGAFSDDDTDVEYLYLMMMEKYGVDPTYSQVKEGWMYHIRDRVWLANRGALGLMHYNLTPPFTGDMRYNPHWFQIDPQLINEIWSYTAPGMPAYAAGISDWAARITSDSWACSPTVVYGAMYSMAFFENDIPTLIRKAQKYLPKGDRFSTIIDECFSLYKADPQDWHAARKFIADKYYVNEDDTSKTIWNADLNGAMGILSLLYGAGDMEATMNIGCSLGFDCDNQTATMCGLLGTMYGRKSVPDNLSMPFEHWTEPFNDRYINVTRHDMPDASIKDIIERTVNLAVKVILDNGGSVYEKGGEEYYRINTKAKFSAPLEFCKGPEARIVCGEEVDYDFSCITNKGYKWSLVAGTLPEGLKLKGAHLTGKTFAKGKHNITLAISNGQNTITEDFTLTVRGKNIAPEAEQIIASVSETNFAVLDSCWTTIPHSYYAPSINVINDGILTGVGQSFYSLQSKSSEPKQDFFGYLWAEPKTVDMIAFHYGTLEEFGGWYSNMKAQYLSEDGNWIDIPDATISPALPESDAVFIQPHNAEFVFSFAPVSAKGFRIIGDDARLVHWHKYTKNVSAFISITELQVYEK